MMCLVAWMHLGVNVIMSHVILIKALSTCEH